MSYYLDIGVQRKGGTNVICDIDTWYFTFHIYAKTQINYNTITSFNAYYIYRQDIDCSNYKQ